MPHQVEKLEDNVVEVRLWGDTSDHEILAAVGELHAVDPRKELCDLWVLAPEVSVPVALFSKMAESIKALCDGAAKAGMKMAATKSAAVATNELQLAALAIYRNELSILPFEFRIFAEREEALVWLRA